MREHSKLSNAASLLICGLLAGVVVAGAAFPVVAVTGLTAKAGADTFDKLPTELTELPPPAQTQVLAADGTQLTLFYEENRKMIKLADVTPVMQQAIVAAEDTRFFDHHGVDLRGVVRAFVANQQAGETTQGASTLTMQYVRQALIYSAKTNAEVIAATEQTAARKLREMRYAIALEKKLSKNEILERYLNIAYFGHRAYGIYAASYVYFSKAPSQLTIEESALLAGLVKAPSAYDPAEKDNEVTATDRRNWVLDRMVDTSAASRPDADAAKTKKIALKPRSLPNECVATTRNDWGFFCDFFKQWWAQQPEFGATENERLALLKRGGFTIRTSIDPKTQAAAQASVMKHEPFRDRSGRLRTYLPALGATFVEPGTGRVKAMAVNRFYSNDQSKNGPHADQALHKRGIKSNYPNTVNPLLSGGSNLTGYQAGSTFKVFTVIAALEAGLPLAHTLHAPAKYTTRFPVDRNSPAGCRVGNKTYWCPGGTAGTFDMHSGLGISANTYFAQLIEEVGPEKAVKVAERLGLQWREGQDADLAKNAATWGAFTLGVPSTTPLDMAAAFATLAADGKYCKPTPVIEIKDHLGNKVDVGQPKCEQVLKPEIARAATDAARCPPGDSPAFGSCSGGATARRVYQNLKRPIAGKTGTTDGNQTAWFVGFTPQLAGAAFIADPDNRKHAVGTYGGSNRHSMPVTVYIDTMKAAMAGVEKKQFPRTTDKIANGDMTGVPSVTCDSVQSAKARLESAGFKVRVYPVEVPSHCPKGTVAEVRPAGRASAGSTITIFVSNGVAAGPTGPPDPRPTCRRRWPPCPPFPGPGQ